MAPATALLTGSSSTAKLAGRAFNAGPKPAARVTIQTRAKKTAIKEPIVEVPAEVDTGIAGIAAIAGGIVANPIMLWSEYTLKTTGAGLPPGPGGALGAAEGVSYLVVLAIIGWSAYTKVQTGSGLPAGPSGLLGAVEGVSYLSLLAGIVVFALQLAGK